MNDLSFTMSHVQNLQINVKRKRRKDCCFLRGAVLAGLLCWKQDMVQGITSYIAYSVGVFYGRRNGGEKNKHFCKLVDKTLALLVLQGSKVLMSP